MDPQTVFSSPKPLTSVEEAWHNEQRRKQYDIIRISNPSHIKIKGIDYQLDPKDHYVMYDTNQYQRVSFNSTMDVPHYIAIRYVKHRKDEIVNEIVKKKHDKDIADRAAKGFVPFSNKYDENQATYETDSYLKTNDPQAMADIIDQLWVGLVHEFGRDMPPGIQDSRSGEVDLTPPEQKIMEKLHKRRVGIPVGSNVDSVSSAATHLSDKKNEYIPQFSSMNEKLTVDDITNE